METHCPVKDISLSQEELLWSDFLEGKVQMNDLTPRIMRRIRMVSPPKQRSLEKEEEDPRTEEDLEMELTGHLQHLVDEVDDEKELVYTLQQLADNVKHEKRKHAVLSKVIRNNLCEEIAKAIEKVDCISFNHGMGPLGRHSK